MKKLWLNIQIFFHFLMRGLHSADKIAFGTKEDVESSGSEINQKLESNNVLEALLRGELTKEVEELRYKTYAVDRESKNYTYVGNGHVVKKEKATINHVSIQDADNLPIITVQDNKLIPKGVSESINEFDNSNSIDEKYVIEITRSFIPKFKLEKWANKIVVKQLDGNEVLLEFYCSAYPKQFDRKYTPFINELKGIMENRVKSEVMDMDTVGFETYKAYNQEDGVKYLFEDIHYQNISLYDGNYIIRFNAIAKIMGEDFFDALYCESQDMKYKNNEPKDGLMFGLASEIENEKKDIEKEKIIKDKINKKTIP